MRFKKCIRYHDKNEKCNTFSGGRMGEEEGGGDEEEVRIKVLRIWVYLMRCAKDENL